MEWLEPWWDVSEQEADYRQKFEQQLLVEVGPDHVLYGLTLKMVGKRDGSDDVLFSIEDGSRRVVMVHLTWSKEQQTSDWPITTFFDSLSSWGELYMEIDHNDFIA